jgi:hypothetical protein
MRAKTALKPYFEVLSRKKRWVAHVTLTFGGHREADYFKPMMHREFTNFMKRLNTDSKGRYKQKYRGIIVYESKKEPDGLFHCHCHLAMQYAPHHTKVFEKWNSSMGHDENWRVHVKYKAKSNVVLNYFAKRIALAGMEYDDYNKEFNPLPMHEYETIIHGKRLWEAFGDYIFIVYGHKSSDDLDLFITFSLVRLNSVRGIPRDVDDPPPELLDMTNPRPSPPSLRTQFSDAISLDDWKKQNKVIQCSKCVVLPKNEGGVESEKNV